MHQGLRAARRNAITKLLRNVFGMERLRDGQQHVIDSVLDGKDTLAIMPTGSGKSLCYQIPAKMLKGTTIVVSPLISLMKDQVEKLEAIGILATQLNSTLSADEQHAALEGIRDRSHEIVFCTPERLTQPDFVAVLREIDIARVVIDEAHCISHWGHDFRPAYLEMAASIDALGHPPLLALTATATDDVVEDIGKQLGRPRMNVVNTGIYRPNLHYSVVQVVNAREKVGAALRIVRDSNGFGIIYAATVKAAEEMLDALLEAGESATIYHGKLTARERKENQDLFMQGGRRVMVATNAFGMGIDKPDVRLVIHADLPGSLENYLQEAGRAGRDRAAARCILLYTPEDVERQFSMSARSRLTQREIQAILKALKNLNRKKRLDGDIIATAGEILAEDTDARFQRDSATDDTRVRTGIAWLEEASLLTREENRVQVFPSSLRVASVDEAQRKLAGKALFPDYQRQLLALVQALISADADEGISTDELMGVSGLSADKVRAALYDLEALGIASNDTALTAFVHAGVERASLKRLDEAAGLEIALIDVLRQAAPDLGKGEGTILHLRHVTQALKDAGHPTALP